MNRHRRTRHANSGPLSLFLLHSAFCVLLSFDALAQVTAKHAALSTASPLATKAGLSVLQKGGTAADAAVAVAFTLGVIHPQAGNLGGGGFLVYYDAQTKGLWTLDFRELAPRAVKRDMFEKVKAEGARAAAVPGTVAGLEALHAKFGARAWKELLAPAIALAHEGPREDAELAADIEAAKRDRKLDIPKTLPAPELATTLQRLADHGARDFYEGDVAKKLVEGLRAGGSVIGHRDLREYQAIWRAPIKLRYGPYEIYTVAPPSGGGVVIGQVLNILASDDLAASGFQSTKSLHLLIEAQRRANIDRRRYVGDPLGSRIPYRELLSQKRAELWRASIVADRATATAGLTEPAALTNEGEHTTHFTIADAQGNIVSFTTSLGDNFGSGFLAPGLGFFVNDALTDFTTGPNSLDPLKRPASPMTPVIILRDGKPFFALGTRGGAAIPGTILQVFLNIVVYGKSLNDAIAAPRFTHAGMPENVMYERSRTAPATLAALNAMGHGIDARDAIGDVHAILFENGRLIAVADPRRGGAAGGY
ncbi:MAG TPA: gamma-glutamyltransferase [Thermoanaerobaculia bacterium]|jgi:gamma-glutamyltranspeptidase/glutathione hydrolase